MRRLFSAVISFLLLTAPAYAAPLDVRDAWSVPTLTSDGPGIAYLTVAPGDMADKLIGATSPAAARIEIHTHERQDGVVMMRKLESLDIPAGEPTLFRPAGLHLMLFERTRGWKEGDRFPLTLRFAQGGERTVEVTVKPLAAQKELP